jgi:hypothetical protein
MNSSISEQVNFILRDGQLQIGDSLLISTQNLRLPVGIIRANTFLSRWIGPFSVLERIASERRPSKHPPHTNLHPVIISFEVT